MTVILFLIIFNIYTLSLIEFEENSSPVIITKKDKNQTNKIKVDIKGQVNKEGVYEVDKGARVVDLIEKAEGLTKNADTSILNLSKKLEDEMVIIIYSKVEVNKLKNTDEEIECNCPQTNDACITDEQIDSLLEQKIKEKVSKSKETTTNKNNKVSINTASKEELQNLEGIGESKAKAIVEYRNQNGKYRQIEDLLKVNGIGESLFEKIKDNITI